ncbi:response regulator transcription factor [Romboutsia sp.]|uniref:response regulator transcription factor n=1 Tax=Romboutsia sp. TaxID=1965302 RepID=UPI003F415357
MNILVASESFIVKDSLSNLFKNIFLDANIKVTSNLDTLRQEEIDELDFAFIDVNASNVSIIETLGVTKEVFKKLKIMVLDLRKDSNLFYSISKNYIDAYILNIAEKEEFIYIVKKVVSGKKYYDSDLLQYAINNTTTYDTQRLTNREHEVLVQVSKGLSNRDIAKALNVTDYTIKKHVSSILTKLSLKNRQDIIIYAKDNGLLEDTRKRIYQ